MIELSQYRLETLHQDGEFILYRGWRVTTAGTSPASILALSPAMERPAPATLKKIEQEFSLKNELSSAWAVRPLALTQQHNRTMLLCEDPGGEPLDRLVQRPMALNEFLRCAIGLAAALRHVHGRGLIHKEIKPSNALVNGALDRVLLRGFGIASRLPRERHRAEPPEFIAGTLAYMAPEQTGRMNRSIDSRSDLYALGVVLYELLTGSLPFTASEPMEWIHCHIARQPMTPAERCDVTRAVSAIVMKLLAKTPEDRYQTAAGAEGDLRRCLEDWDRNGSIHDFPPGEHDIPDRLVIPEKLYGREEEIETLLASFDRMVSGGTTELVLVSGYSGIGKSSVVNELQPVLVPPRGLFASGKFDQYKRDIPYATLAQAFQSLIRPLLKKSETELGPWRRDLCEALDQDGQLIVDLVPELKLVVGDQPPLPEVAPQDAQRRFQLAFRRFIGVFARPEHPLALFLDDLQWLDAATLDLLEDLLTRSELQHLLLIGAYRDNEVDAAHPLARKLDAIKRVGGTVREICLAPLTHEHLEQLLADSLRCEAERCAPFAQLVHAKTGGNPFFTIQFLASLVDEDLLVFDHDDAAWSWDLDRIHAKGYTENVVDLMVGKLARLPTQTQTALQQLACLGNVAEIATLSTILDTSPEQVHAALWESLRQGLVEQGDGSYRFVHDRVHEAAYSLIPQASRAEAHVRIGRLLASRTSPEEREEAIFDIVNHLNRGAALITSAGDRENLAELNLIAGKRAKASTAYASALSYFVAGATLLNDDGWDRCRDLMFTLEMARAECEFLTSELKAAEERLTALLSRAANTIERAAITLLQIGVFVEVPRLDLAVAAALEYLRQVGIEWSLHPTEDDVRREYERIGSRLQGRTIEDVANSPLMSNPKLLATVDVLAHVIFPALRIDPNLSSLITFRAVNLSLEQGNYEGLCLAYAGLGRDAILRFRDYRSAFRFGRIAIGLVESFKSKRYEAITYHCYAALIAPWMTHARTFRDIFHRVFDAALKIGDVSYANYSGIALTTNLLVAGDPLGDVQREAERALAFAKKTRGSGNADLVVLQLALVLTLRGLTPTFGCFDSELIEEGSFERHLAGNPSLDIQESFYWIRKMQARYFAGDYKGALDASTKAQRSQWMLAGHFEEAEYHFFGALCRAAYCDSVTADDRVPHVEALAQHWRQLELWAKDCRENFECRAALAGAEMARVEGRDTDAMRLYEQAIHSSRASGFVHTEALAFERASGFYRTRGFDQFADTYLRSARTCYATWGADGKVRQLDRLHRGLVQEQPVSGSSSTFTAPVEGLDLATVIRVSQAVSSEIVLDNLLDTVMRTAMEHAGADRALLFLRHGDQLQARAEATTDGTSVAVRMVNEVDSCSRGPESLLRYVVRTHEAVILDEASVRDSFADDPYLRERGTRSVACLPLLKQGELVAVLYLENTLASDVFTPARLKILEVLASQAAIALENTRLYRDLEQRETEIRALKDQLYRENLALRDEVDRASMFEEIVGASAALKTVLSRVSKVAPSDATVFISGETGTGKELVARAVHKRSQRSSRAFVSVNCAALAPTLISSELFGYEKGAFTGATQRRLGRFELADGGTIFLDEVGELLPDTQAALLRVLQEREFERVGGSQPIHVDVRVIAATNRDLPSAIANGSFRQDLFYRLNVFPIDMPPLRERKSDLLTLVEYFVQRYAGRAGKRIRSIDKKTLDLLQAYDWPGNIRELQNVIERSVILTSGEVFVIDELWLSTEEPPRTVQIPEPLAPRSDPRGEREAIEAALAACRGRVAGPSGAAAKLNTPASTLEHRIRALKIDKRRFKFR